MSGEKGSDGCARACSRRSGFARWGTSKMMDAATVARVMGGRVERGAALVPGPNHSAADRSLRVFCDPDADGGFRVHSFAGDDPIECRDYVRLKMGLPAWEPNRRPHTNGTRSAGVVESRAQPDRSALPSRTPADADG